jgi:ribosomal protein L11 methyltransferase
MKIAGDYISFLIYADAAQLEIEIALLNELGVESFIEHEDHIEAFIPSHEVLLKTRIEDYLNIRKYKFTTQFHESKDWNAVWEMNFNPIQISDRLLVRAPFHPPSKEVEQEILIAPKMAFGTGHHETTSMILEWLINEKLEDKEVLDFGCGTGILGIYAAKNFARVSLIDNDPLAIENAIDNLQLNQIEDTILLLGSSESIPDNLFDLILANITRNVLSQTLTELVAHLKSGGKIIMSGFLKEDLEFMKHLIENNQLELKEQMQKKDWLCLIAVKK